MIFLMWFLPSLAISAIILGNKRAQRHEYLIEVGKGNIKHNGNQYYTYPFECGAMNGSLAIWTIFMAMALAAASTIGPISLTLYLLLRAGNKSYSKTKSRTEKKLREAVAKNVEHRAQIITQQREIARQDAIIREEGLDLPTLLAKAA